LFGVRRSTDRGGERSTFRRLQVDEVGRFPRRQIAYFRIHAEQFGSGSRAQVEKMRGRERVARRIEPLEQICLQPFLQHAETGAGADIGSKGEPDAGVQMTTHREKSTTQRGIATGAVGDTRRQVSQAIEFGYGRVYVMGEDSTRTHQVEFFIDVEIVLGAWESLGYFGDFA
jgi:hypothetical protein